MLGKTELLLGGWERADAPSSVNNCAYIYYYRVSQGGYAIWLLRAGNRLEWRVV